MNEEKWLARSNQGSLPGINKKLRKIIPGAPCIGAKNSDLFFDEFDHF
jgi:hypothetical protein